jgi:hypothetical protein
MSVTSSTTSSGLKFLIGWVLSFVLRLIPFRPPNLEPILAIQTPFTKRYGFIIGSDYYTQGNFSSDYMVTKFDENRNVVWSKTIGTSYDDELMTLKPTSDGGYILAGHSSSDSSGDNME